MTRDKRFALLVQTGAILQDLTSRLSGRTEKALAAMDALDVLGLATDVTEYELPADVVKAARDFLDWAYGVGEVPTWLPDRMQKEEKLAVDAASIQP